MDAAIANIVFACPGNTEETYALGGRALASFYADLLGMQIIREDWFIIANEDTDGPNLAFGDGPIDYQPPRWPDPEYPQQMHLDIPVYDLETADELALRLGATKLQATGEHRIYADPDGHPFCFYSDAAGADPGAVRCPAG